MSITTWIEGSEKQIAINWSQIEFQVEADSSQTLSTITLSAENSGSTGEGKIYFDSFKLEEGVTVDEEDITYVTKLDHTDVLPASVQHHLLVEPYLHEPKAHTHTNDSKAKVSSGDTTADYLVSKITAGANVTVIKMNAGGNETLEIASTATGGGSTSCSEIWWPPYPGCIITGYPGYEECEVSYVSTGLDASEHALQCIGADPTDKQGFYADWRFTLPVWFSAWATTALKLTYRTQDAGSTNNALHFQFGKTGGAYTTYAWLCSDSAGVWKTLSIAKAVLDAITTTPGDTIEFRLIFGAVTAKYAQTGKVELYYTKS